MTYLLQTFGVVTQTVCSVTSASRVLGPMFCKTCQVPVKFAGMSCKVIKSVCTVCHFGRNIPCMWCDNFKACDFVQCGGQRCVPVESPCCIRGCGQQRPVVWPSSNPTFGWHSIILLLFHAVVGVGRRRHHFKILVWWDNQEVASQGVDRNNPSAGNRDNMSNGLCHHPTVTEEL